MSEKSQRIVEKLEAVAENAVDYVIEHPIKALIVSFAACKIMKWLKD